MLYAAQHMQHIKEYLETIVFFYTTLFERHIQKENTVIYSMYLCVKVTGRQLEDN